MTKSDSFTAYDGSRIALERVVATAIQVLRDVPTHRLPEVLGALTTLYGPVMAEILLERALEKCREGRKEMKQEVRE